MTDRSLVLAFDTSNYKTSVAIVDKKGNIIKDLRTFLKVKEGERGLRQSEALFQHVTNLPGMVKLAFSGINGTEISAVAASDKPRPVQESYMPCFRAGEAFGDTLATGLGVPFYRFSHQEGHLAAIKENSDFKNENRVLAMHLSGGTTEFLKVDDHIDIIGGSRDISFGQVLDRAGVLLGFDFPCGEKMDQLALKASETTNLLKPVPVDGLFINLSGMDTQIKRTIEDMKGQTEISDDKTSPLIREIFDKIAQCLIKLILEGSRVADIDKVLMAGGVSSSVYISGQIKEFFRKERISVDFGIPELASDNAVGIGYLGRKMLWPEDR